jgi:hypothetical protein
VDKAGAPEDLRLWLEVYDEHPVYHVQRVAPGLRQWHTVMLQELLAGDGDALVRVAEEEALLIIAAGRFEGDPTSPLVEHESHGLRPTKHLVCDQVHADRPAGAHRHERDLYLLVLRGLHAQVPDLEALERRT